MAKTQKVQNGPTLFSVFDYYDEKGELQNDVFNPSNRYRDQRADRAVFQGQGETSGTPQKQRELSGDTARAGSISKESEGGGIRRVWEYDHTRGDMGDRSEQIGEKTASDSSQSTDRVLFRQEDLDDNRGRLADSAPISQSTSVGRSQLGNTSELSSQMDNGNTLAVGETSLSQSNKGGGLRQTDLFSGEAAGSGDRSVYAGITSTQHSEPNTLWSVGSDGSKPQSTLPRVDEATNAYESQSQQYMGHSNERTQRESNRGELLENSMRGDATTQELQDITKNQTQRTDETEQKADSNSQTTNIPQSTQIPNFVATRQRGEAPSLIAEEEHIVVGENYKLGEDIVVKGLRTRFEANIAAITILSLIIYHIESTQAIY